MLDKVPALRKLASAAAVLVLAAAGSIAYVAWPSSDKSPLTFIPHAKSLPLRVSMRESMSPLAWCVYRPGTGRFAVLVEGEKVVGEGAKDCPSQLPPSQVVNWYQRCDQRSGYDYVSVYAWCHYRQ